jgi:hypothetical protein
VLGIQSLRVVGTPLVLRRFEFHDSPSDGVCLRIAGRPAGMMAWLISLLGFDNETTLEVSLEKITLKTASLYGQVYEVAPLTRIASTHCGYVKPIQYLIVAAVITLIGVFTLLLLPIAVVVAAVLGLIFWFRRTLVLGVVTTGGRTLSVAFKPGLLGGVAVDLPRALQAMGIVSRKVLEMQSVTQLAGQPPALSPAYSVPVPSRVDGAGDPGIPPPALHRCASCGSEVAREEHFCGECGAPVRAKRSY